MSNLSPMVANIKNNARMLDEKRRMVVSSGCAPTPARTTFRPLNAWTGDNECSAG